MNVVYGLEFLLLCSYPHQYLVIFHTILITAFNLKDAVAWLLQHWQFSYQVQGIVLNYSGPTKQSLQLLITF